MIDDMKNTWCKRIILIALIIIILLLCPIVLNYILGQYTPCNIEVIGTEVNWLDFWGAYIGAIIGALITLLAMGRETNRNALNIMITNQENLIKELKEQLTIRIGELSFESIGNFLLYTSKNNRTVDKRQIDDAIKKLNDYQNRIVSQFNSWAVIYATESNRYIGEFNEAYKSCVYTYEDDVKTMIGKLKELKSESDDYRNYNAWLEHFNNSTLKIHQENCTDKMFSAVQKWLQFEQDKLNELQKQAKSFFPRIK